MCIEIPDELLTIMSESELAALSREALLVKLYDLGEIGSGKAAKILGISRRAFLELLDQYGVSWFDDTMDIAKEARYG